VRCELQRILVSITRKRSSAEAERKNPNLESFVIAGSTRVHRMLLAVDLHSVLLGLKIIGALTMNAIAPRPRIELHAGSVFGLEPVL
jgi:hypothetical protein